LDDRAMFESAIWRSAHLTATLMMCRASRDAKRRAQFITSSHAATQARASCSTTTIADC
jgi:hypothetical protein